MILQIWSINMCTWKQMLPRTLLYAVHGPRRKRKETLTPRLPPSKLQDQTLNGQYRLALFTIQVNADPYPSWVSNYHDQTRNSLAPECLITFPLSPTWWLLTYLDTLKNQYPTYSSVSYSAYRIFTHLSLRKGLPTSSRCPSSPPGFAQHK